MHRRKIIFLRRLDYPSNSNVTLQRAAGCAALFAATGTADQDIAVRKTFNAPEAPLILCSHGFSVFILCMSFYYENDIRKSFYNKVKLLPWRITGSSAGIYRGLGGEKLLLDE